MGVEQAAEAVREPDQTGRSEEKVKGWGGDAGKGILKTRSAETETCLFAGKE